MTVASSFVSWNRGRTPGAPFTAASPNLLLLAAELRARWNLKNLGIYTVRPVRGGTAWSSHAFGAALDAGYGIRHGGPGIEVLEAEILPWLIENSAELGIQRIHQYQRTATGRPVEAGLTEAPEQASTGSMSRSIRSAGLTCHRSRTGSQQALRAPRAHRAPQHRRSIPGGL